MSFPPTVGRYRIDRVLGSGAFAAVWLGHDEALDSQVAIKVLSGSLIDDLDVRNRFLEEARILRRADSARLVRVHDIGELPDGRPYFVMSYADRGTLGDRMRERPLPVAQAIALAEEIAYGVEVINKLGVIHRDLKPSNVLFQSTPDGGERLLIADLGLAKALAHASGAFTLPVGTPGYMSPEQARFGGGLDVRADVYGLGALTYHMLTGRPPGAPPVRVPPSGHRAELSPAFDQVVMRAMEMEREKRWPTAEAFAEALSTLRPTSAGPAPGGRDRQPAQAPAPPPRVEPARPTIADQFYPGAAQPPAPQPPPGPGRPGPGGWYPEPESPTAEDRPESEDALATARFQQQPDQAPRTVFDDDGPRTVVDQPGAGQYGGASGPRGPGDDLGDGRTVSLPSPYEGQGQGGGGGGGAPGGDGKTAVFPQGGGPQPPQGPPPGRQGFQQGPPPPPGPGGPYAPPGPGGPGGSGPGPGGHGQGQMPTGFQPPSGPVSHRAPSRGLLSQLKDKLPGAGSGRPAGGQVPHPAGPPGGPGGPGGAGGPGGQRGSGSKSMTPLIIGAVILSVALVGGLLLGSLLTGDDGPEQPKRPALPKDFVQLAEPSGKIRAAVPKAWPRGQETTWRPNTVGLNDAQSRPVLRATPSVPGFVGDGRSPGVFIGLTTAAGNGSLPPRTASQHPQCTSGGTEQYTSPDKSLTGTITRFTGCRVGTPTVVEVGLRHSSGKFGAWVRVKETDTRNLTKTILDNLKLAAPQ